MARKIEVQIVGDASSLNRALTSVTGSMKMSVASWAKGAVVFQGVQAAQDLLTGAVRAGIGEWQQQTETAAQTAAVIKSTGGAANITAKQFDDLNNSLMKKTGIDDELIASGGNILLTFKDIRNEVGKGNDIFNQTETAMLDLSTAMHIGPEAAALQLGKALNDPARGMSRLQRIGVTFTDAQKAAVKAMMESGNVMGAQKVILRELNSEFGGSAVAIGQTLPGQLAIARESFNNFAGEIVARLVPAMQTAVAWLRDHWPQISAAFGGAWASIKPILTEFGNVIAAVAGLIQTHWGTIGPIVQGVVTVLQDAAKIVVDVLKIVVALLQGDWSAAWAAFKDIVVTYIHMVQTEIATVFGAIQAIVGGALGAVRDLAVATFSVLGGLLAALPGKVAAAASALKDKFLAAFNSIKSFASSTVSGVVGFFASIPGRVAGFAQQMLANFKSGIAGMPAAASGIVTGVISFFSSLPGKVTGFARDAGKGFVTGISSGLAGLGAALKRLVVGPLNAIIDAWNGLGIPSFSVSIPVPMGPDISFSSPSISLPDIPHLAKGGIVTRPTLALIGERGPEAVVPLPRGARGGGGGGDIHIHMPNYVGDKREMTNWIRTALRDIARDNPDALAGFA